MCPVLCAVLSHVQFFVTLLDCSPPGSSVHGDSLGKNTGVGCHALLQGNLPNSGIEPRSLELQADSLPTKPPGKPKNTGVGSLPLLKGIFQTQESNWCLHQCTLMKCICHLGLPGARDVTQEARGTAQERRVQKELLRRRYLPSPAKPDPSIFKDLGTCPALPSPSFFEPPDPQHGPVSPWLPSPCPHPFQPPR